MKYETFAEVMKARAAGELTGELCLFVWKDHGTVTLDKVLEKDEDDWHTERLYYSESMDTFLIEVAEAMGWDGAIS